jgi:hypothetical protein
MPSIKKLLQAAAGNAGGTLGYVEDVFSTYLYTANNAGLTITNGIDLAGEGGLVWGKSRSATQNHRLYDTEGNGLYSNLTNASFGSSGRFTANSDGFDLTASSGIVGGSGFGGPDYTSWSFRKAEKFFDVVTYTGDGVAGRTVAHNLGSAPGMIIVKKTSGTSYWPVYHVSRGIGKELFLNLTDAETAYGDLWEGVTSTNFTVSANNQVNFSGDTYVAYLFASDAGGFGESGEDNVISCGSFTTGSGGKMTAPVNLGYEAQWLLAKNVNASESWVIYDIMRGMNNTGYAALNPNSSGAEYTGTSAISATATGFDTPNASGPFASSATYIYIAIRRPMKTPTVRD